MPQRNETPPLFLIRRRSKPFGGACWMIFSMRNPDRFFLHRDHVKLMTLVDERSRGRDCVHCHLLCRSLSTSDIEARWMMTQNRHVVTDAYSWFLGRRAVRRRAFACASAHISFGTSSKRFFLVWCELVKVIFQPFFRVREIERADFLFDFVSMSTNIHRAYCTAAAHARRRLCRLKLE